MKYVVTWTNRAGGSGAENEEIAAAHASRCSRSGHQPETATFHQFVGRADGNGGFAVIETDNLADVMDGPIKFGPYFDFHVYPVIDVAEAVPALAGGDSLPRFDHLIRGSARRSISWSSLW